MLFKVLRSSKVVNMKKLVLIATIIALYSPAADVQAQDYDLCATVTPVCLESGDALSWNEGRRDSCAIQDQDYCREQANQQLSAFASCLDDKDALKEELKKIKGKLRATKKNARKWRRSAKKSR